MKVNFNLELFTGARKKAATALSSVWGSGSTWINLVRESYAGAWQQGITLDSQESIVANGAVFSCVTGIASDIAKLRVRITKRGARGVQTEVPDHWATKLLRRPNRYQNRIQFVTQWVVSKLLHGNTYTLPTPGTATQPVGSMYVLDPTRVKVLVAADGSVYYQLRADNLTGLTKDAPTVPAALIMHDVMCPLWHPLVGVSPLYASAVSATMGNKIQRNSMNFFGNASRPSGMLSAPGEIHDETAARLKAAWEENFSGQNIGRLAVLGDNLKYEPMTIPAGDAQLIEQLKWTVEDIARCYHYPLYKLGGQQPAKDSVGAANQIYYDDCLQILIESLELCLNEGLKLDDGLSVAFDLNDLLRMDSAARYTRHSDAIKGGWLAPNEARVAENYDPVDGGDSPMMQQQNWTLAQLAERKAPADAASVAPPPVVAPPEEEEDEDDEDEEAVKEIFVAAFGQRLQRHLGETPVIEGEARRVD